MGGGGSRGRGSRGRGSRGRGSRGRGSRGSREVGVEGEGVREMGRTSRAGGSRGKGSSDEGNRGEGTRGGGSREQEVRVEGWKGMIIIYNYLTGKLREFYFTNGSQDQFCRGNLCVSNILSREPVCK